jgi:hypothetical protein
MNNQALIDAAFRSSKRENWITRLKALFQYGYDCASAGRLWTTFGHSSAADNRAREALVARDLKCPTDDQFIAHFAQSQR